MLESIVVRCAACLSALVCWKDYHHIQPVSKHGFPAGPGSHSMMTTGLNPSAMLFLYCNQGIVQEVLEVIPITDFLLMNQYNSAGEGGTMVSCTIPSLPSRPNNACNNNVVYL